MDELEKEYWKGKADGYEDAVRLSSYRVQFTLEFVYSRDMLEKIFLERDIEARKRLL